MFWNLFFELLGTIVFVMLLGFAINWLVHRNGSDKP